MRLYLSNARYDLAALPWLYEPQILKVIEPVGLSGKFLMRTDYPLLDSTRYEKMLLESGIGEESLERIFRSNAASILDKKQK
jgi:predicted TIM-barrel fold metal-dependent hydrolase